MPEYTRIVVTVGGKGSIGGYENAERTVTIEAAVNDGETVQEALDAATKVAKHALGNEWMRIVRATHDFSWLAGRDEQFVRRLVAGMDSNPAFNYLKRQSPEEAQQLLAEMADEMVAKYARQPGDEDEIEEAQELLDDVVDLMVAKAADPGEEAYDDEDDDEGVTEGFPRDDDDDEDEDGYTGDGFTEQFDDGYPADAHPDEVEYEDARATYPDLPPYAEAAAPEELPEELPFAAEGEDGQAAS